MSKLTFVPGQGFIQVSTSEPEQDAMIDSTAIENRDSNTLDILSSLQTEINVLKADKKSYVEQLNKFRLMMLPVEAPLAGDATKWVKESILEMLANGGIDKVDRYMRHVHSLAAECSILVEDYRSRDKVRAKVKDDSSKALAGALAQRGAPRVKKGPNKYTPEEKIISGIRKTYPGILTQTQLVAIVQAINPKIGEEAVRTFLDKQTARLMGLNRGK